MRKIVFAASAIAFCLPGLARAALLRPFSEINGTTVRLGDLFDKLGDTPDRVLGPAPAPGARIEVRAPQLAAIARDFNVDWRPSSGSEQAVIERRGALLPGTSVTAALHSALVAAGAPDDADFAMPDIQPVMLPAGVSPKLDISQCNYDSAGGHFTALLTVSAPDMAAVQMRVSGNVVVLTSAAVPTHRLVRGAEIAAGDVQPLRVRASLLRGNPAVLPERAIGMILKHDVAAGKPLTLLDLERQELVQRGSLVRMSLNSEGIALGAEGIAKESGAKGDHIHVENPSSHVVVEAEVTGPDEVRVAPRAAAVSLVAAQ